MSLLRNRLNQKGFTLFELLVVMAILSFVLMAAFALLDKNYQTVRSEMTRNESRDELKIFSSFLIQDLMYSEEVEVFHAGSYDMLHYRENDGQEVVIKFDYEQGIYEMVDGVDELVAKGKRTIEDLPMVREEDGLIVFNFSATETNASMDLSIRPRLNK